MEHIIKKLTAATISVLLVMVLISHVTSASNEEPPPSSTANAEVKANSPYDYTLVWMTDTQYYTKSYPHIYRQMVDWIAANKDYLNIPYVFHTGDVVNKWDSEEQWQYADQSMNVLEKAQVPYGVLAGNHDVDLKNNNSYEQFYKHFGENRVKKQKAFGGSYKNNRGHYDLIEENGEKYIMVYMGWGIKQGEINWLNQVLAKHSDRIALLSFHDYLLASGKRSPIGEEIFEKVVTPNKNVVATLNGHYYGSESVVDEIDDDGDDEPDRKVFQMVANYQSEPEGGQGYMRLLNVNSRQKKIYVKTYSPYLNSYSYNEAKSKPGEGELVIELPELG
ncbi:metallophosphoesterase [Halobacillus massiliensis]|uniref:metallophosphoesterase n=1 Tax=Halobacillus massiliensis TaxID=1926286 RepID=UPI0009E2FCAA|nr:metallophosphoesterase [Halobacillus massiliensis]